MPMHTHPHIHMSTHILTHTHSGPRTRMRTCPRARMRTCPRALHVDPSARMRWHVSYLSPAKSEKMKSILWAPLGKMGPSDIT